MTDARAVGASESCVRVQLKMMSQGAAVRCQRVLSLLSLGQRSSVLGRRELAAAATASASASTGATKTTTNIVGLNVLENAREELMKTYKDILSAVKIVPEDAQYRKNVELLTRHRLKVVTEEEDLTRIEERIGMGQVEELHVQAVRELNLIPKMAGTEGKRIMSASAT